MRTKNVCVLIHILSKEVRTRLVLSNMFKPFSNFLTDRFRGVPPLWIVFVNCIFCFSVSYCLVFSLQPCGYLPRKGRPLSSLLCVMFSCEFVTFP